jgi:hypothetical protein
MHRVADRFQAALRERAAQGADAARIAEMAVATWRNVDIALSPIIGNGGVTALYRRSVYLTVRAYPWMAEVTVGDRPLDGLDTLQTALSRQTGVVAAAANCALLQTFCDLLSGLIGAQLTEHLLQSAWGTPSGGPSDQEHAP